MSAVPAFKGIPVNRRRKNPVQSSSDGQAVTTSDTATFDPPFRRIFVGGAGNVTITTLAGNSLVFTGVLAGTILPWAGTQVKATGTTATNIVAGFDDW